MSWQRNVNVGIAKSHQFAGQLIGMQLAVANVLAQVVSALSIVAGATMLAVQQFPSAWLLWIAAAVIGIGLAMLIEGLTLGALIRIRVTGREIHKTEQAVRNMRDEHMSKLTIPDPADPHYPLLIRRFKQARKFIRRENNRTCNQVLRQARRDQRNSLILAMGGCLASMCGGGLFYHAILGGMGQLASIALSAIFTLAVTGTFISSEIFRDLQEQAIRESFVNGSLTESAIRQEIHIQALLAVHQHVNMYLQSPKAQKVIDEGGKLLVTRILEELHQELQHVFAEGKPSLPEAARDSQSYAWSEREAKKSQCAMTPNDHQQGIPQGTVRYPTSRQLETQGKEVPILETPLPTINHAQPQATMATGYAQSQITLETGYTQPQMRMATGYAQMQTVSELSAHEIDRGDDPDSAAGYTQPQGEPLSSIDSTEFRVPFQSIALQHSYQSNASLDRAGRAMLKALKRATSEERMLLLQFAQEQTLTDFAHTLQARYPSYASFFTEERVASVMTYIPQLWRTSHSSVGDDQSASQSEVAWDQQKQSQPALQLPRSNATYELLPKKHARTDRRKSRQIKIAQITLEARKQHIGNVPHRERIQAVLLQAEQAGISLNYREVAQAAGVSYATVKKYAPDIRLEAKDDQT